jgi:hypothetical protein
VPADAPPPSVDPLLPLSFLEAVRTVDAIDETDLDAEYVAELRNKRLGLSDTVYAQLRRYADAVKRKQRVPFDEAVALARLLGRRPDAAAVFRVAGRYLAGEAYRTVAPVTRRILLILPALLSRPIALRHARRIAERYLDGRVTRLGSAVLLEVRRSVTADAAPAAAGGAYYEAALQELLVLLVGNSGAVEQTRSSARGDGTCEWRAEWRPLGARYRAVAA